MATLAQWDRENANSGIILMLRNKGRLFSIRTAVIKEGVRGISGTEGCEFKYAETEDERS